MSGIGIRYALLRKVSSVSCDFTMFIKILPIASSPSSSWQIYISRTHGTSRRRFSDSRWFCLVACIWELVWLDLVFNKCVMWLTYENLRLNWSYTITILLNGNHNVLRQSQILKWLLSHAQWSRCTLLARILPHSCNFWVNVKIFFSIKA